MWIATILAPDQVSAGNRKRFSTKRWYQDTPDCASSFTILSRFNSIGEHVVRYHPVPPSGSQGERYTITMRREMGRGVDGCVLVWRGAESPWYEIVPEVLNKRPVLFLYQDNSVSRLDLHFSSEPRAGRGNPSVRGLWVECCEALVVYPDTVEM